MDSVRPLIHLDQADLDTLKEENLLNGWVINAFFRIVERRSVFYQISPKVFCIDTGFFSAWESGKYLATRDRARSYDIFNKEMIFFPVYLKQVIPHGHWSLIVAYPASKKIRAYDSIGFPRAAEMEIVRAFLQAVGEDEGLTRYQKGWRMLETLPSCPRQRDAVSCGVFTCVFGDRLSRRSHLRGSTIDPQKARKTILEVLIEGRFDRETFPEETSKCPGRQFLAPPIEVIDLCSPARSPSPRELDQITSNPGIQPVAEAAVSSQPDRQCFALPTEVIDPCSPARSPSLQELDQFIAYLDIRPYFLEGARSPSLQELDQFIVYLDSQSLEGSQNPSLQELDQAIENMCLRPPEGATVSSQLDRQCLAIPTEVIISRSPARSPSLQELDHFITNLGLQPIEGATVSSPRVKQDVTSSEMVVETMGSDVMTEPPDDGTTDERPVVPMEVATGPASPPVSAGAGTSARGAEPTPGLLFPRDGSGGRQVTPYQSGARIHQPWIPDEILERLERIEVPSNRRKRRSRKWKIFLSDGSRVRVRLNTMQRKNK